MSSRELEVEITEKEAPYAPEEQWGVYKATRWTFREKQEATMRASKILDKDKGLVEMDLIDFQVEQMISCITPPEILLPEVKEVEEGEKPISRRLSRKQLNETLDADVVDILLNMCRKVNGTTSAERMGFLGLIDETKDTPG